MELSGNLTILSPRDQRLRHVYWVQGWGFRLVYQIISNSARLQIRKLKQNKPKQANKKQLSFHPFIGLRIHIKVQHERKNYIVTCAPKGKEYDKKRKRKEEMR